MSTPWEQGNNIPLYRDPNELINWIPDVNFTPDRPPAYSRVNRHPSSFSRPPPRSFNPSESDGKNEKIVDNVLGLVNLFAENVILHPLIVIRRQCQVTRFSSRYHLTPFSVVPLIYKIRSSQGSGALWKGLTSNLIVKGLFMSCESFLAGLFDSNENLMFKGISFIVITPFLCANSAEIVQSSIASETPGVFDCLKEGLTRWTHWNKSGTRLLPFWALCFPTASYHLLHHIISSFVMNICYTLSRTRRDSNSYRTIVIRLFGQMTADIVLYPFDTALQRLYLQGTRTIIDNIDTGNTVLPVISAYDGAFECFHTIKKEESTSGLYKGIGALVLQYSLHFALVNFARSVCKQIFNT